LIFGEAEEVAYPSIWPSSTTKPTLAQRTEAPPFRKFIPAITLWPITPINMPVIGHRLTHERVQFRIVIL
jgi:hypothetical protein